MNAPKPSPQEAEISAEFPPSSEHYNAAPKSFKPLLLGVFWIGVALASGLVYGWKHFSPSIDSAPQVSAAQLLGLADYESLEPGMTLTEARSILGKGIETSRSETEANFVWRNLDGSKITAVFKGEKLKSKAQDGLK